MTPHNSSTVSTVKLLKQLEQCAIVLAARESVASIVVASAKRRIVMQSIDEKELEKLLQAARAAGDAEGYARARFEMTLEAAKASKMAAAVPVPVLIGMPPC